MKKILSCVTVVLLLLGIMAFAVTAAAPDATLTIDKTCVNKWYYDEDEEEMVELETAEPVQPGDTVILAANLTKVSFASYEVTVKYDATKLTLVEIYEGDKTLGGFTASTETGIILDYTARNKNLSGNIFYLEFEIAEDADVSSLLEVTLDVKGFFKQDATPLNVEIVNGGVQHNVSATVYENFVQANGETFCDVVTRCADCGFEVGRVQKPYVKVTVGTAQGDPGSIVTVPVSVSAAKYASYELTVKYGAGLTLVEIEEGEEAIGSFTANTTTGIIVDYTTKDKKADGEIILLHFEVAEGIEAGSQLEVSVEVKDFYKASGDAFAVETVSGGVIAHAHDYKAVVTAPTCTAGGYTTYTCRCGESYVADETAPLGHTAGAAVEENRRYENGVCYVDRVVRCATCGTELSREKAKLFLLGDANNDGEISVLDAMMVAQYIVGDIGEDAIVMAAANVNGDSEINVLDAMVIAQFIVGDIDVFPAEEM